jgi:hypothetical protein
MAASAAVPWALTLVGCARKQAAPVIPVPLLTVCELSRSFAYYAGRFVAVRGVYYGGLRQRCSFKCFDGSPWPAALDLTYADNIRDGPRVGFTTDQRGWDELDRLTLAEARKGGRIEIWVTAVGEVRASSEQSPLDPCVWPRIGYGHLGGFPAQLVIKEVKDIEVRLNPDSTYDYSLLLRPRAG